MESYLLLQSGAAKRLAILRRDAAQWFEKNPHAPKDRVLTWRDVRFASFLSPSGLSAGQNEGKPVWATFDGPQFRRERFADQIVSLGHAGWFSDVDCAETVRGIVDCLPHGRFIAGYYWSDGGERVYYPEIYDDADDAARAADSHAERYAELCRDDSERWNAARTLEIDIDDDLCRLRECIALRHRKDFPYVRDEIGQLIESIRAKRGMLNSDYADIA